jgi:hypothetical protein
MPSSWHSLISFLRFPAAGNSEDSTQFSSDYCSVLLQLLNSQFQLSDLIPLAESESESESYVTTDCQPASLSWNKAPIWGLRPDLLIV